MHYLLLLLLFVNAAVHGHFIMDHNSEDAQYSMLSLFGGDNPKATPNGERIVDGDIVLQNSNEDETGGEDGPLPVVRKAISNSIHYWPNKIIPYTFHSSVSYDDKEVIKEAMDHWMNMTCIRFREKKPSDRYFVNIRSDTAGCWSLVGRRMMYFSSSQDLSIGRGCAAWATVVHELGHVIGFYHEQSRSDRDEAIHINWENVKYGFYPQFRLEKDQNFNVNYDYSSIMQYAEWAFSKDVLRKNTIVTLDPRYQRFLGRYTGLTFRDRKEANLLYSCSEKCLNRDAVCLNGGYLRDFGSNYTDCRCDCPPNTYGELCQHVTNPDYYEAIWPLPCGGNITEPGYIETPNYPKRLNPFESCVWQIQAPADKKIEMTFEGFEFNIREKRPNSLADGRCLRESVEIRLEHDFMGEKYCEKDIEPGTKMISNRGKIIIIILADKKLVGKGLRAKIEFTEAETGGTAKRIFDRILSIWNNDGKKN